MNRPAALIGAIASLSLALPASAAFDIVINPNSTLAANGAALAAFNRAAAQWESKFTDDVTVQISAGLASLGAGILGQNSSEELQATYGTFRSLLTADAADEPSNAIVALLPATLTAANVALPAGRTLSGNLVASKANLKALGVAAASLDAIAETTNDATITFSTNFSFDYDNSNGVGGGTIDFESVATHEIGHALGFSSEVDIIDVTTAAQYPTVFPSPLDLFRFASNPGTAGFTAAVRELRPGAAAVTSDGTVAYSMSTGDFGGDGNQASHFKDNLGIGIMDPTLGFGEIGAITAADLRAFDLIGWDVAVPEPTTLAAVGGALAVALRRRRPIG